MNNQVREGYKLVHTEWLTPFQSANTEYRIAAGALSVRTGERFSIYIPDVKQPKTHEIRAREVDEIIELCGVSSCDAERIYDAGYRKFEIVEGDV